MPAGFVAPQLATLVSAPPRGEDWVHEIKFDGYRLLAVVADRQAELFTRAANDWSERFKPLCAAFAKLKVSSAVIDGEVVHLADDGTFSFHGLQNALSTEKLDRLRYYAFDLLHLNGVDLRARPLTERKALLHEIMAERAGQAPLQRAFCRTRRSGAESRLRSCARRHRLEACRCALSFRTNGFVAQVEVH